MSEIATAAPLFEALLALARVPVFIPISRSYYVRSRSVRSPTRVLLVPHSLEQAFSAFCNCNSSSVTLVSVGSDSEAANLVSAASRGDVIAVSGIAPASTDVFIELTSIISQRHQRSIIVALCADPVALSVAYRLTTGLPGVAVSAARDPAHTPEHDCNLTTSDDDTDELPEMVALDDAAAALRACLAAVSGDTGQRRIGHLGPVATAILSDCLAAVLSVDARWEWSIDSPVSDWAAGVVISAERLCQTLLSVTSHTGAQDASHNIVASLISLRAAVVRDIAGSDGDPSLQQLLPPSGVRAWVRDPTALLREMQLTGHDVHTADIARKETASTPRRLRTLPAAAPPATPGQTLQAPSSSSDRPEDDVAASDLLPGSLVGGPEPIVTDTASSGRRDVTRRTGLAAPTSSLRSASFVDGLTMRPDGAATPKGKPRALLAGAAQDFLRSASFVALPRRGGQGSSPLRSTSFVLSPRSAAARPPTEALVQHASSDAPFQSPHPLPTDGVVLSTAPEVAPPDFSWVASGTRDVPLAAQSASVPACRDASHSNVFAALLRSEQRVSDLSDAVAGLQVDLVATSTVSAHDLHAAHVALADAERFAATTEAELRTACHEMRERIVVSEAETTTAMAEADVYRATTRELEERLLLVQSAAAAEAVKAADERSKMAADVRASKQQSTDLSIELTRVRDLADAARRAAASEITANEAQLSELNTLLSSSRRDCEHAHAALESSRHEAGVLRAEIDRLRSVCVAAEHQIVEARAESAARLADAEANAATAQARQEAASTAASAIIAELELQLASEKALTGRLSSEHAIALADAVKNAASAESRSSALGVELGLLQEEVQRRCDDAAATSDAHAADIARLVHAHQCDVQRMEAAAHDARICAQAFEIQLADLAAREADAVAQIAAAHAHHEASSAEFRAQISVLEGQLAGERASAELVAANGRHEAADVAARLAAAESCVSAQRDQIEGLQSELACRERLAAAAAEAFNGDIARLQHSHACEVHRLETLLEGAHSAASASDTRLAACGNSLRDVRALYDRSMSEAAARESALGLQLADAEARTLFAAEALASQRLVWEAELDAERSRNSALASAREADSNAATRELHALRLRATDAEHRLEAALATAASLSSQLGCASDSAAESMTRVAELEAQLAVARDAAARADAASVAALSDTISRLDEHHSTDIEGLVAAAAAARLESATLLNAERDRVAQLQVQLEAARSAEAASSAQASLLSSELTQSRERLSDLQRRSEESERSLSIASANLAESLQQLDDARAVSRSAADATAALRIELSRVEAERDADRHSAAAEIDVLRASATSSSRALSAAEASLTEAARLHSVECARLRTDVASALADRQAAEARASEAEAQLATNRLHVAADSTLTATALRDAEALAAECRLEAASWRSRAEALAADLELERSSLSAAIRSHTDGLAAMDSHASFDAERSVIVHQKLIAAGDYMQSPSDGLCQRVPGTAAASHAHVEPADASSSAADLFNDDTPIAVTEASQPSGCLAQAPVIDSRHHTSSSLSSEAATQLDAGGASCESYAGVTIATRLSSETLASAVVPANVVMGPLLHSALASPPASTLSRITLTSPLHPLSAVHALADALGSARAAEVQPPSEPQVEHGVLGTWRLTATLLDPADVGGLFEQPSSLPETTPSPSLQSASVPRESSRTVNVSSVVAHSILSAELKVGLFDAVAAPSTLPVANELATSRQADHEPRTAPSFGGDIFELVASRSVVLEPRVNGGSPTSSAMQPEQLDVTERGAPTAAAARSRSWRCRACGLGPKMPELGSEAPRFCASCGAAVRAALEAYAAAKELPML